ncbi:MAG TPA: 2,3-bisphosphoglycerate-independent phosphoglycerate mutase [Dongiaceae bacterium]|jgi:2,3-bisphosphoglycerate-independent phosphoglycerate mutase|nr:2,3-bisphosphoglycerate-independent phosphoglycerate mutase [Dongiaceae bacterium]
MSQSHPPRPVVLCILDGWGEAPDGDHNAIALADTPVWDELMRNCPHGSIDASELHVGLPAGQMGNSEVGHMNIGAGRVVMQDLPRIDAAVQSGELAANPQLQAFIVKLKASGGTCHLMGLMSPGGVHSHQAHIATLVRVVTGAGVPVALHAFLDGRDTPPSSARGFMTDFLAEVGANPRLTIATVGGRYWAMDRDKRWERVALAYAALVDGAGERAPDALTAIDAGYVCGETDEFIKPTVVGDYRGMADGDGVLMANFRADRVREILTALLDPKFDGFLRSRVVHFAAAAGMTEYSTALKPFLSALFPPESLTHVLGEVVAGAGLKQLRIAETEKYAHVTFFLNGGEEKPYPGEERILVPSPKVATYDLKPEMSAYEVTDKLVAAIESGKFDLIVVNYANTDMVGHTGDLEAAIKAVEAVDRCLGRVRDALRRVGGAMLITADHGNAEVMEDPETHQPHTAHTLNRVPLVFVNGAAGVEHLGQGRLADIAPTLLAVMGLPQPREMTGRALLPAARAARQDRERRASL